MKMNELKKKKKTNKKKKQQRKKTTKKHKNWNLTSILEDSVI